MITSFRLISILALLPLTAGAKNDNARRAACETEAINCAEARKALLKDLNSLVPEGDPCKASMRSTINQSYGSRYTPGACQATYGSLNYWIRRVGDTLTQACGHVNEAKRLCQSCTTQRSCMQEPAAQYRLAARKIDEAIGQLESAQRALAERGDQNRGVAGAYANDLRRLAENWKDGVPPGTPDICEGYDPSTAFGDNCQDFIRNDGFNPSNITGVLGGWEGAFDTDPRNDPTIPLGPHFEEQRRAFDTAHRFLKHSEEMRQRVGGFTKILNRQSDIVMANARDLSSLPTTGDAAKAASTISRAKGLGELLGAGAKTPEAGAGAGATGPNPSLSRGADTAAAKDTPRSPASMGFGEPVLSTDSEATRLSGAGKSPDEKQSDAAEAAKESGQREFLQSFLPGGATSLQAKGREKNESKEGADAAHGSAGDPSSLQLSGSSTERSRKEKGDPKPGEEAGIVARLVGRATGAPEAGPEGESPSAKDFEKASESSASLRELLRARLAARNAGEESKGAEAIDALLGELRPLARGGQNAAPDDSASEQAGPQGIESDPLFQRIHDAHERFFARSARRQAGI